MKILFISPHPDDIEFACGSTEAELVKHGHEVYQLCITGGEYGIEIDEFKGERISKIRRRELRRATKVIGIKKVDFFGLFDGYVEFNKKHLTRLVTYIKKINPNVVFSPDPFYPVDHHNDHIKAGYLGYHAVKSLKKRPLLILFYTYSPNYYVQCKYLDTAHQAFDEFPSQGFANKLTKTFNIFYKALFGLARKKLGLVDSYRIVDFRNERWTMNKKQLLLHKLFSVGVGASIPDRERYKPTPEELGLKEYRFKL